MVLLTICPSIDVLEKAIKVYESYSCKILNTLLDSNGIKDQLASLTVVYNETESLLETNAKLLSLETETLSNLYKKWSMVINVELKVLGVLKTCNHNVSEHFIVAEGWCPTEKVKILKKYLQTSIQNHKNGSSTLIIVQSGSTLRPTIFPSYYLIDVYQELTFSYSIPSFKEFNPSLIMISSFPFMFSLMFGDIGHAIILIFFSLVLHIYSKNIRVYGEFINILIKCRFVILYMGICSVFSGLIYNDFFSKSITLFPSMFLENSAVKKDYVYPFGIDYQWNKSSNSMVFSNSFKMKQSVIFGFFHMLFGLFVATSNDIHFRNVKTLILSRIPQILFFISIYGYLSFIIILKWLSGKDMSLLNIFITMIMEFGSVDGEALFTNQYSIQKFLFITSSISVLWMFFGIILIKMFDPKFCHFNKQIDDFYELFVNNTIHTIEFILGSISNTASYLRLWALSLAHAQLSEVVFDMVLVPSFAHQLTIFPGFLGWFLATIIILVIMEGVSAFLHSLRLHWVEFNSKFFEGNGMLFKPFTLNPCDMKTL